MEGIGLEKGHVLGIDVGSIAVSIVKLDSAKRVLAHWYSPHRGQIKECLKGLPEDFDFSAVTHIAATSNTSSVIQATRRFDSRVAVILAARHLHEQVGSIIEVGGEKFGVITFDEQGNYLSYKANTSCAAGTGGFLDQQATRLNFLDIEEFSTTANSNTGKIPKIATRCAVFAKTDLIHAQQEGYHLAEICDGLSFGLAKNIVDTLFGKDKPQLPVVFIGGVSKNPVVVKHLANILGSSVEVGEYSPFYPAIGAALSLIDEIDGEKPLQIENAHCLLAPHSRERVYHYQPLQLTLSNYPDFTTNNSYIYVANRLNSVFNVEVDIYKVPIKQRKRIFYLGLDIGSTSTKAMIIDEEKEVIAGFYTRTFGRPMEAVGAIFESINDLMRRCKFGFRFGGVGTTGSGRKFIGKIIDADIALDEITAHARAAYELDPKVDTIIEIGGQDAKFTTMRNGVVTFSVMNSVCAAGTGSFIEEQAKKMGCELGAYSSRAGCHRAPMASDRCTVFMERDLNYYLSEGYAADEILAAVLHSVRENYLTKVAVEKNIGDRILFQGATAKNKALVAAFEQKLGKPIMVSRYCHLTGALGVALDMHDQGITKSNFRGIKLFKKRIPVTTSVCNICTNNCKIRIAKVGGEKVAFGFLCGKDYHDKKRVEKNPSKFDLLKVRQIAFHYERPKRYKEDIVIGLPAALHLFEDLEFWQRFFDSLSIKTVTSTKFRGALKEGSRLTGAEFCAPITALHGHVQYLTKKADYIFLPNYLEERQKKKDIRRQYCYYTQYSTAITTSVKELSRQEVLNPLIKTLQGSFSAKLQLYKMLKTICKNSNSLVKVSFAYDKALEYKKSTLSKLQSVYQRERANVEDISVVLIGRPYTVLSSNMNNGIPEIFAKQGIKVFFQDMLPVEPDTVKLIEQVLTALHWNYGAKIVESAQMAANIKGLYPVLISSFKCTPDSYVIEYFKNILDAAAKPYLILQLDEHDSSIGYETRIEAAIRSFKNHYRNANDLLKTNSSLIQSEPIVGADNIRNKTLLLPNWDLALAKLMEAVLKREGFDARILEETPDSIQRSLSLNTGQCLPLTAVAQASIDYIEKHRLLPKNTVIWNVESNISCNIGMFPYYIKKILEAHDDALKDVGVFAGEVTFLDFGVKTSMSMYFVYMFSGLIKRIGCQIRPYEVVKGATDAAIERALTYLYDMFLNNSMPEEETLIEVVKLFEQIEYRKTDKPKVAIFGDLYLRDNCVFNQNLLHTLEANGAQVITTSYSDYMKIVGEPYIKKWLREGRYKSAALGQLLYMLLPKLERKYYKLFAHLLDDWDYDYSVPYDKILKRLNLTVLHTGESMENILKLFALKEHYPDLSLCVQANPAYCCPAIVTESMSRRIEELIDVPIVTIEYDGIGGLKNDKIVPYLKFSNARLQETAKNASQHSGDFQPQRVAPLGSSQ